MLAEVPHFTNQTCSLSHFADSTKEQRYGQLSEFFVKMDNLCEIRLMGRPSVQAQRKEEILAAFEVCVARYGVEGATLERIAEQAGLARPLIRHHMGNREDLIDSLADRFFAKSSEQAQTWSALFSEEDAAITMIDLLFDPKAHNWESVMVAEALIGASATRPELAKSMARWVQKFRNLVATQLQKSYPHASKTAVRVAATGILGIYFNVDSLEPLGAMGTLRKDSKEAAKLLVSSLAN